MRVKSPIRSTRVRYVRSPVSGSSGQLLPNKSEAVAYFKGSPVVDTIGNSSITFSTGSVDDLLNASWSFSDNSDMRIIDTNLGGDALFDSSDSMAPITRYGHEWLALDNLNYLFVGQKGIAGYSSEQGVNADKIQRVLGASAALMSGDSTFAEHSSGSAVADLIEQPLTASLVSIAVSGDTVSEQSDDFQAIDNKYYSVPYVVIQLGLNDIAPTALAATIISDLQTYISTVRSSFPASKIIVSQMTPARQRYIDFWGETGGATCYQIWQDVNEAIAGNGATPITGVQGRVTSHVSVLSDVSGNLASFYDSSDHIHPNEYGREVNANAVEDAIHTVYTGVPVVRAELVGGLDQKYFASDNRIAGMTTTVIDTVEARRISIDGQITRVWARWEVAPNTGEGIQFRVYRLNGGDYNFVSASETIESGSVGENVYDLSTPMDCKAGDLVGIYLSDSTTRLRIKTTTDEADALQWIAQDIQTSAAVLSMTKADNYAMDLAFYGLED